MVMGGLTPIVFYLMAKLMFAAASIATGQRLGVVILKSLPAVSP